MSGGTEQVRYFVSGEYEDETGTFKLPEHEKARLLTTRSELDHWVERPNTMDKVSLRTNVNANLTSATEVGVNIGYVTSTVPAAAERQQRAGHAAERILRPGQPGRHGGARILRCRLRRQQRLGLLQAG